MDAPRGHRAVELAAKWGVVADCVYRSNSWGLCDVDNRAFAVQAANTFLGQADQIASKPETFSANQTEVGIPETGEKPHTGFHPIPGEEWRADRLRFHSVSARIGAAALAKSDPEKNACAKQ
jgi:hypothetical protein